MLCFFDTNILVYQFVTDSPNKSAIAKRLYLDSVRENNAIVSVQVLQEFFVTVSKKLEVAQPSHEAERAVRDFSRLLKVVETDVSLVLGAMATFHRYRISFWDALIVQAALRAGAEILYTEDLQDGQVFESLTVRNPFAGVQG
jgi:predicted nucleic acid-binding protein